MREKKEILMILSLDNMLVKLGLNRDHDKQDIVNPIFSSQLNIP